MAYAPAASTERASSIKPIAMRAHFEPRAKPRGLRRHADVSDDRNAGAGDRADAFGLIAAALELDRTGAALFDQANRGAQRVFVADLVGAEGHVGHDVRARRSARDGLRVVDHAFQRDRRRFVEAENDVADAIADENDVDAGALDELAERRVVRGRDRKERLALAAFDRSRRQAPDRRILLRLVRTSALDARCALSHR